MTGRCGRWLKPGERTPILVTEPERSFARDHDRNACSQRRRPRRGHRPRQERMTRASVAHLVVHSLPLPPAGHDDASGSCLRRQRIRRLDQPEHCRRRRRLRRDLRTLPCRRLPTPSSGRRRQGLRLGKLLRQLTIAMARRAGGFTRIASGTFGPPPPDCPVGPSLGSETCEQTVSDLFALVDGHRSTASRSSPMPTKRDRTSIVVHAISGGSRMH